MLLGSVLVAVAIALVIVVRVRSQPFPGPTPVPDPWQCPRCGHNDFEDADFGLAIRCLQCGLLDYSDIEEWI